MNWTGQRLKAFYSCGGVLWIFCGVGFLFLSTRMNGFMFVFSIVIGIANALMMVQIFSLTFKKKSSYYKLMSLQNL